MPTVKSNERWTCEGCGFVVFEVPMAGENCPRCGCGEFESGQIVTVCDFCSATNPIWAFPARDFQMPDIAGAKTQMSRGGWAACDDCKRDIVLGNLDAVARRSLANERGLHPEIALAAPDELLDLMKEGYRGFMRHRTGPPYLAENE